MNKGIQFKRTRVPQGTPEVTQLLEGELCINLVDKKLYTKYNNEVINIGFDYDTYVGNNFLARSGGPLTGLLSFDNTKLTDVDDLIKTGSDYNLVHKGFVQFQFNLLDTKLQSFVPTGLITNWKSDSPAPQGWTECDGIGQLSDGSDVPNLDPLVDKTSGKSYPYIIKT